MMAEKRQPQSASFAPGPRIYCIHKGLARNITEFAPHLARISGMKFDWVLLDGHTDGSESAGFSQEADSGNLQAVCAEASAQGLRVMADIVADGHNRQPHLADRLLQAAEAGISGFRCRHAHAVPAPTWSELFAEVRARRPDILFLADSLGAPLEDVLKLEPAGFNFLFNSACWWDFHEPWLLDQYDRFRRFSRTVSFPESPYGPPLVETLGVLPRNLVESISRSRYLFAAAFSSGVLMPMGYEYGANGEPTGVGAAADGENGRAFDLSGYVGEVNGLKARLPALNAESRIKRLNGPDASIAVLLHLDHELPWESSNLAVVCVNPSARAERFAGLGRLLFAVDGGIESLTDVTPGGPEARYQLDIDLLLEPFAARLLVADRRPVPAPGPGILRPQQRLRKLSANRVVIERVAPEIDGGRFPAKAVVGDTIEVQADVYCDGHDRIGAALKYRHVLERDWHETLMTFIDNDRWGASFTVEEIGRYQYTIEAWRDQFRSWREDTLKKHKAGQPVHLEAVEGLGIVRNAAAKTRGDVRRAIHGLMERFEALEGDTAARLDLLMSEEAADLMQKARYRTHLSTYDKQLEIIVDRSLAQFGAWYELMPRSQSGDPRRHGTFDDVIARLPYVRDLGFDILYLLPIHPIGRTNRKGPNNTLIAGPDDPGSPYAIGSGEGGHDAIQPELGTFEDFARLVDAAHQNGLEIALDFAIQCSPDHPWIGEHPEWFDWRPDGSIKFAENPPKKYEDIVNVHFYRDALPSIWYALRDVILFWVDKGVKVFRVDNPHTKPVPFWEWMIRDVQDRHPDTIFLSEAFTRPKMMRRLAKVGFTQSYSYFTWRNTKQELTDYLTELTQSESRHYMRPNFFANTPDINPYYLQTSGRPGFQVRLVLAATLATSYGLYNGFELCEAAAMPGKEEYLYSEKYELKAWDWDRAGNIREDVRLINHIRKENPALWQFTNLAFLNAWNDNILAYYKLTQGKDNCVVIAVNLDTHNAHGAHFEVPLWEFGLPDDGSIEAVDLVGGQRLTWTGKVQHIWLDPAQRPYAIWRLVPPPRWG